MYDKINEYILNEELVPVKFTKEMLGSSFIVSQENVNDTIPEGFKASIPFWLAKGLKEEGYCKIEDVKWLNELGPNVSLQAQRSYDFGMKISEERGDSKCVISLYDMLMSRSNDIINLALKLKSPNEEERCVMTEEKQIIKNSRKDLEDFYQWKKTNS